MLDLSNPENRLQILKEYIEMLKRRLVESIAKRLRESCLVSTVNTAFDAAALARTAGRRARCTQRGFARLTGGGQRGLCLSVS